MENWRGFIKEEEAKTAAHSPYTLDTPDGIRKLIDKYRTVHASSSSLATSPMNTGSVADPVGLFATEEGKAVYKGNGDKYEAEVFNYFLEVPEFQPFRGDFKTPAGSSASRADLDFYLPYGDEGGRVGPIKVEMKLNVNAQLGGSSIGVGLPEDNEEDKEGIELVGSVENPKLNLTLAKDSGFDAKAVEEVIYPVLVKKKELLAKVPKEIQKALIKQYDAIFEKASTQIIVEQIDKHKGYLSKEQLKELSGSLTEASEKKKAEILEKIAKANQIFPLTTSTYAWKEVKKSGVLAGLNENIEEQKIAKFLIPHYKKKEIYYIQIGNVEEYISKEDGKKPSSKQFLYGLYRMGKDDPYNLASIGVPSLEEVMGNHNIGYRLELRPGPAGSTKPKWCENIVKGEDICKLPGVEDNGEAYKMRSVNYRVQGRFKQYPNKITEESLDNPSILEEIGDSATEETNGINNATLAALQDLKNIGKEFLKQNLPIEEPEAAAEAEAEAEAAETEAKEINKNDQKQNPLYRTK